MQVTVEYCNEEDLVNPRIWLQLIDETEEDRDDLLNMASVA